MRKIEVKKIRFFFTKIPWVFFVTEAATRGVLKKFRNIHRKTPVLESLLNKVAGLKTCNFIKKRLKYDVFLCILGNF